MSDVTIAESSTPLAGYGLFAKRFFRKGEIVTISPVLALPTDEVLNLRDSSVLQNYVLVDSESQSHVALLPIGYAGAINHAANASLSYSWCNSDYSMANSSEQSPSLQASLNASTEQMLREQYSRLDLKYVAMRDIEAGEELTIDYGRQWTESWAEYLAETLLFEAEEVHLDSNSDGSYHRKRKGLDDDFTHLKEGEEEYADTDQCEARSAPIFRSFMKAPSDLFPKQWNLPIPSELEEEEKENVRADEL
jgi:hypothetical protein